MNYTAAGIYYSLNFILYISCNTTYPGKTGFITWFYSFPKTEIQVLIMIIRFVKALTLAIPKM